MLVSKHRSGDNRAVRVVCALLASIVASGAVAYAHPVRDPFDELEPFPLNRDKGGKGRGHMKPARVMTPEEMCERNASWPKLVKCLGKGGLKVKTLYDRGTARLVSVESNATFASVFLYRQNKGRWERAGLYLSTSPAIEILSFERFKHENGYRIEQGSIMRSSAFTGGQFPGGPQTSVQVTLRRVTSSVCLDNNYCQSIITSCEALVDGKTRWSFHGTLRIDHGQIRMSGDPTYAGQICAPSSTQLSDVGDVLE